MQKRKEDRVFKHYFIMYFFVLLIPMTICCTYYSYMFFVINEDDISSRKNDLFMRQQDLMQWLLKQFDWRTVWCLRLK